MKQQNGFIATSLLYSFFLAFVTIFIAMVTIYIQNRVYLNKLEDSSKNSIYIREMKKTGTVSVWFDGNTSSTPCNYINDTKSDFKCAGTTYIFAKCEIIYKEGLNYYVEGCS